AVARGKVAFQAPTMRFPSRLRDDQSALFLAHHIVPATAESFFRGGVEPHNLSLVIDADDRIERGIENGAFARLARAKQLLGLLARGDVFQTSLEKNHPLEIIPNGPRTGGRPDDVSFKPIKPRLEAPHKPRLCKLPQQ